MKKDILDSIVEMTRQRDLDSLEISLVATLVELIEVTEVSFYKLFTEDYFEMVEEIVNLKVVKGVDGNKSYSWGDNPIQIIPSPSLIKCLKTSDKIKINTDTVFISLFPIMVDNKPVGAIQLNSNCDMSDSETLIEGLVKIYTNYQVILHESEHDPLTKLLNRRTFDKKLNQLLHLQASGKGRQTHNKSKQDRRNKNSHKSAWLVTLDIDDFKQVNDNFGHVCGDEVILTLAQRMRATFRKADLLFRFGGEEFVVVLHPVPLDAAAKVIEKMRADIASFRFPLANNISVSVGYTAISPQDYPPLILERADKALYYAKQHGKNRVCFYEELIEKGKLTEVTKTGSIDLF